MVVDAPVLTVTSCTTKSVFAKNRKGTAKMVVTPLPLYGMRDAVVLIVMGVLIGVR
jgi:hypothetical protein